MKSKLFLATVLCSTLFIGSCKKKEVADVTISYEVTLSNPSRNATIEYINDSGGEDLAVVNTSTFTKSFTVKSNATKVTYGMYLTCYSKYVSGSSTDFQSQTVTIDIKEDDKVIKTITRSGSSNIYINSSEINASLPSATKYK